MITIQELCDDPALSALFETALDNGLRPTFACETWLTSAQGATSLLAYHFGGHTIVVPCGETQNADAYVMAGCQDHATVLAEYLSAVAEEGGE